MIVQSATSELFAPYRCDLFAIRRLGERRGGIDGIVQRRSAMRRRGFDIRAAAEQQLYH
jgi:hypothetical protein